MTNFIKKAYTKHLNALVEKYWNIYHFDMNPNHCSHNNEADAFKHCIWQAEMTLFFGVKIAKFLGDTHEDRPDNPDNEKNMDLHNNQWERIIGDSYRVFKNYFRLKFVYDTMADNIMLAMRNGELITEV